MGYMYDALKLAEGEHKEQPPEDLKSPPKSSAERLFKITPSNEIDQEFSMLNMQVKQAHAKNGTKVIAVTSSVPGEGKTTIAHVLSRTLSHSTNGYSSNGSTKKSHEHGVLLIDGDLDKPSLHLLFKTPPGPGLTDFIYDKAVSSIYTHNVSSHSLCLITAGTTGGNKAEIWNMEKIKKLFIKLRENFEYILIDAPPVIGHSETIALCKLADGVLFVIKANETRLEVAEETKEQLESAGVNILGAVLNERRFFIPDKIYKRL